MLSLSIMGALYDLPAGLVSPAKELDPKLQKEAPQELIWAPGTLWWTSFRLGFYVHQPLSKGVSDSKNPRLKMCVVLPKKKNAPMGTKETKKPNADTRKGSKKF